jgi:hypothetical protein
MDRDKGLMPSGSMIVSIIALIAALGGTAFAAATISGNQLKNDSVKSSKIKNKTLKAKDFSKKARSSLRGPAGAPGPQGPRGPQGVPGPASPAEYTNPNWAVIDRNTEGSPVATLAGGPFFTADDGPPVGDGSLHIETASNAEKVSFGNQVDFAGDPVSGLDEVSYSYTQTGEDFDRYAANLPNVALEINPSVAGRDYTSMVYVPPAPTRAAQQWITTDAGADDGTGNSGWWFSNGQVASATGCTQADFCSLDEAKQALEANNDGGPAALIGTIAVAKGKDYQYQGSVDALQINDTVYDFEPFGVEETPAP